jgi:hypothetical protein
MYVVWDISLVGLQWWLFPKKQLLYSTTDEHCGSPLPLTLYLSSMPSLLRMISNFHPAHTSEKPCTNNFEASTFGTVSMEYNRVLQNTPIFSNLHKLG